MAHVGDAYVQFPIDEGEGGDYPKEVHVRVVQQVHSASVRIICHPGGGMTGSLTLAPTNHNRVRFTILNSGTLPLGLSHGHGFTPNVTPTVGSHWDNIIPGTNVIQQGNQPTPQSVAWEAPLPCYTGPLVIAWFGSGTLSGSCCVLTEFVQHGG